MAAPSPRSPLAIVVGTDPDAVAEVAKAAQGAGGRAAVFVGDPAQAGDRAALVELVAELFGPSSTT
jgi:hypothetical protein